MKPNMPVMLAARAEVDEYLNKALVLIAEGPGEELTQEQADRVAELTSGYVRLAKAAVDRLQDAARGS